MNLLKAIHARHAQNAELQAAIPGGLYQDWSQREIRDLPYSVIEDVGGTKQQCSDATDGPEDRTIRYWFFGDDADRVFAASEKVADDLDDNPEFTLVGGIPAYASRSTSPRFVMEEELMKPVVNAYQVSFESEFQM